MPGTAALPGRTPDGRFAPGHSGNPAGRPKGATSYATRLVAALREGEAETILRAVIEAALDGDKVAARFCAGRIDAAARRGEELPVLDISRAEALDPYIVHAKLVQAVIEGRVSAEHALLLVRLLAAKRGLSPYSTSELSDEEYDALAGESEESEDEDTEDEGSEDEGSEDEESEDEDTEDEAAEDESEEEAEGEEDQEDEYEPAEAGEADAEPGAAAESDRDEAAAPEGADSAALAGEEGGAAAPAPAGEESEPPALRLPGEAAAPSRDAGPIAAGPCAPSGLGSCKSPVLSGAAAAV